MAAIRARTRSRREFSRASVFLFVPEGLVDRLLIGARHQHRGDKGKKLKAGRGTVGKTAVVGAKDRKTNKVRAKVTKKTDAKTESG